jgi:hypothetical protein
MTEGRTLSVIVTVYNTRRFIGECLSSILARQDAAMEVIVVDDGSTDGTNVALEAFSDTRLRVVRTERIGPGAARNAGFRCSRGKFILPLDGDDVPITENWSAVLTTLAANPDAALAYGERRIFQGCTENLSKSPSRETYPANHEVIPLIFRRNFMQIGGAIIRREAIEAAGLWNEDVWHGEDWEMWCRLACVGAFIHCPVLMIGYRQHAQSLTGATVSRDARDPGLAAIDVIYSHPVVRQKAGAFHHRTKQRALAWRTYLWGIALMRSGHASRGVKALCWAVSRDPSLFLNLCSIPRRRLQRLADRREAHQAARRRALAVGLCSPGLERTLRAGGSEPESLEECR